MADPALLMAVPRTTLYDIIDRHRRRPIELEGGLGQEILDYGAPYSELHRGSITLRDQSALFQTYLLLEAGVDLELPDGVRDVINGMFSQFGRGNVTDDACEYLGKEEGSNGGRPEFKPARWITHPVGFEKTGDGWKAIIGKDSQDHYIMVPRNGYVELTNDGAYRPDTGTPFSTAGSREMAERSWISRGFGPELARDAAAYFFRREGKGVAVVYRWCSNPESDSPMNFGRFGINATDSPDDNVVKKIGSWRSSLQRLKQAG
jgi:hypothetical protein